MKSPSKLLIDLQTKVERLLDSNGTRLPQYNDRVDQAVAKYTLAKVIKAKAEKLEEEAKALVCAEMKDTLSILADGAPAMNIHATNFTSLNAEKRGRENIDSKVLINELTKLAEDHPKLKKQIDAVLAQSKKKGYALYLTPTINAIPE